MNTIIVSTQTWIFYPSAVDGQPMTPATYVSKLATVGVKLIPMDGGVIVAHGPSNWFTEANRKDIRGRVRVLYPHLISLRLQKDAPVL